MENKEKTEKNEQELDFEGWKKYIEHLYSFYKRVDEENEKEQKKKSLKQEN